MHKQSGLLAALALTGAGLVSPAVLTAAEISVPLPTYNSDMTTYSGAAGSYPTGSFVALTGVTYDIPATGNNVWNSYFESGPNPRILDVPVSQYGVDTVHALLNTFWGEAGPGNFASVEFIGSGGLSYTVNLDGNSDIRDFLLSDYTNFINGTTTVNAFTAGSGRYDEVRLDETTFDLPDSFLTATLETIRFSDDGADGFQRLFVAGVTVETTSAVPEAGTGMAGIGLLALAGLTLRRQCRRA